MKQQGFSLVELSIVLVILGLLTGGILGGQSLIKAAELRAVGTEYEQWQTAVNNFKSKYFAIPGDMRNAEQFWGRSGVGDGKTWNGNGNGRINLPAAANAQGEKFTFWQHLSLAGMIPGTYTGVAGSGDREHSLIGVNLPTSKFSSSGWSVTHSTYQYGPDDYVLDYGNAYQVGAESASWENYAAIFTPEEAWNLDTKFDDGRPAQGMVIANLWGGTRCTDAANNTDLDSDYRLSDSGVKCSLFFRNAF